MDNRIVRGQRRWPYLRRLRTALDEEMICTPGGRARTGQEDNPVDIIWREDWDSRGCMCPEHQHRGRWGGRAWIRWVRSTWDTTATTCVYELAEIELAIIRCEFWLDDIKQFPSTEEYFASSDGLDADADAILRVENHKLLRDTKLRVAELRPWGPEGGCVGNIGLFRIRIPVVTGR